MANRSGKAKTRKGVAKRFKITGSGKVMRLRPGKRHILEKKSRKQKRNLGKLVLTSEANAKNVLRCLPFN